MHDNSFIATALDVIYEHFPYHFFSLHVFHAVFICFHHINIIIMLNLSNINSSKNTCSLIDLYGAFIQKLELISSTWCFISKSYMKAYRVAADNFTYRGDAMKSGKFSAEKGECEFVRIFINNDDFMLRSTLRHFSNDLALSLWQQLTQREEFRIFLGKL